MNVGLVNSTWLLHLVLAANNLSGLRSILSCLVCPHQIRQIYCLSEESMQQFVSMLKSQPRRRDMRKMPASVERNHLLLRTVSWCIHSSDVSAFIIMPEYCAVVKGDRAQRCYVKKDNVTIRYVQKSNCSHPQVRCQRQMYEIDAWAPWQLHRLPLNTLFCTKQVHLLRQCRERTRVGWWWEFLVAKMPNVKLVHWQVMRISWLR